MKIIGLSGGECIIYFLKNVFMLMLKCIKKIFFLFINVLIMMVLF